MSDSDYVFDEYVNGTPERQARYIYEFRIKLANLRTVVVNKKLPVPCIDSRGFGARGPRRDPQ